MGSTVNKDSSNDKLKVLQESLTAILDTLPHLNDEESVILAKSADKIVEALIII
jgi:hypothetical protein